MLERHRPCVVNAQQQVMATFRSIWALVRHQEPQDASQCGLSSPLLPSSLFPAVAVSSLGHAQFYLPSDASGPQQDPPQEELQLLEAEAWASAAQLE